MGASVGCPIPASQRCADAQNRPFPALQTLLIFNSLISGSWAASQQRPGDAEQLRQLGRRWEAALLALCDDKLFFQEVGRLTPCGLLLHHLGTQLGMALQLLLRFTYSRCRHASVGSKASRRFADQRSRPAPHSTPHPTPVRPRQLEEFDQTCLEDIQHFDDGASLAGYAFSGDGFPPAGRTAHTPEQHAAAAHPAPHAAPAAAVGGKHESEQQQPGQQPGEQQQQAAADAAAESLLPPPSGRQLLGSPASRELDEDSLRKAAYRYRHISKLLKFGLGALGTAAQRQEWQVRACAGALVEGRWWRGACGRAMVQARVGDWGAVESTLP